MAHTAESIRSGFNSVPSIERPMRMASSPIIACPAHRGSPSVETMVEPTFGELVAEAPGGSFSDRLR